MNSHESADIITIFPSSETTQTRRLSLDCRRLPASMHVWPLLPLIAPLLSVSAPTSIALASGSGSINYFELNSRLRSGNAITLAEELRSGAVGAIETRARNSRARSPSAALPLDDGKSVRSPVKSSMDML